MWCVAQGTITNLEVEIALLRAANKALQAKQDSADGAAAGSRRREAQVRSSRVCPRVGRGGRLVCVRGGCTCVRVCGVCVRGEVGAAASVWWPLALVCVATGCTCVVAPGSCMRGGCTGVCVCVCGPM